MSCPNYSASREDHRPRCTGTLQALEKRSQTTICSETHKHQHRCVIHTRTNTRQHAQRYEDVLKCIHSLERTHTHTQPVRPICRGTANPSRSLASDCQGELRKWGRHVVSSSARCAADTAGRLLKPKVCAEGKSDAAMKLSTEKL